MLRNEVVLREIIEGRMKGKACRGRKRLYMLNDLRPTSSAMYAEVKMAAEDREGWRAINRRGMP